MTVLSYNGFQGSVEFEDNSLIIQILHIDDFITTECESARAAQGAFEDLVDDYLATCAQLGREPCKPFKGSFNVRMAPELHKRVSYTATAAGETLNAWVVTAIEEKLSGGVEAKLVAAARAELVAALKVPAPSEGAWKVEENISTESPQHIGAFFDQGVSPSSEIKQSDWLIN